MPPETEENGAHAQEQEANCSLQRKIRKRSTNVDCGRWTYSVPSTEHGKKERKKERTQKVGFSLFEKKMNHSEIRILILIS